MLNFVPCGPNSSGKTKWPSTPPCSAYLFQFSLSLALSLSPPPPSQHPRFDFNWLNWIPLLPSGMSTSIYNIYCERPTCTALHHRRRWKETAASFLLICIRRVSLVLQPILLSLKKSKLKSLMFRGGCFSKCEHRKTRTEDSGLHTHSKQDPRDRPEPRRQDHI